MGKTTDSVIFSDAEQEILEIALQNPALSNSEIADQTGYRLALIRDTRRQYEDEVELADGVAEAAADSTAPAVDIEADLSETEQVILDLVAENPLITNAEIAEKTGARVALVRDTRDAYGDQIDSTSAAESEPETESTPSGPGEPSAVQQEILEVAASDHSLSNADIAEQTGSRITLVRDTLDQYDGPTDSGSANASETAKSTDIETEGYSAAQAEILEAAAANPEATNRELAERTGSRVTLVRDTLAAETADDSEEGTDDDGEDSDDSDVLADVDTEAFSGPQLRILEAALSNPESTNAEIAAETDTRITLVRDTIYDYEYDEKPWIGNVDDEPEDDSDEDDEIIVESDDNVEIPDTTASELFNDRQRAVLETALENPEMTNGEIAERTGARLTLVRDTRATYEDGVELPEDNESEETTATAAARTVTFSEKQKAIIAAAEADEEASIADLAEQTGSRIPLVRDTLSAAEDSDVEAESVDDASPAESSTDTASTEPSPSEASSTDTSSAEAASTADEGGLSDGLIVAIVVAILLLFGIGVLVL